MVRTDNAISINAASVTLRAIGPICAKTPIGEGGWAGTRPKLGFNPKTPVKALGMRIEPAPSLPTCNGPSPAAQAAAAPALLPPGVRERSQGLRVIPVSGLSPNAFHPNSGVVVLPIITAPASRNRAVAGASSEQS